MTGVRTAPSKRLETAKESDDQGDDVTTAEFFGNALEAFEFNNGSWVDGAAAHGDMERMTTNKRRRNMDED